MANRDKHYQNELFYVVEGPPDSYNGLMFIRIALFALLLFGPTIVLADVAPTSAQGTSAASNDLGPSTTGGVSSSADGSTLQPAGGSPLQSTTNDSGGLNPVSTDPLQATATGGDQLRVLLGSEADGTSHDTLANGGLSTAWANGIVILLLLAATAFYWFRGRRLKRG